MKSSSVSAPAAQVSEHAGAIDLTKRLADLDEQRLAQLPDGELVATMNQRRYLADLKQQDEWKRRKQAQSRKRRFKRPRQF